MIPWVLLLAPAVLLADTGERCRLCSQEGPACVRLTAADARRAAVELAQDNAARIARLDAMLASGALGPPGPAARERARLLARAALRNAYSYLFSYAASPDVVYEADAAALEAVFREFAEPGLFPLARLQRVRLGRGAACAHYDLRQAGAGETMLGEHPLPWRVEDRRIQGVDRRVLVLQWPSVTTGRTEVLVAAHHSFQVTRLRSPGPPAPYEVYAVHGIEGAWLARWGVHRPTAYMFWASPVDLAGGRLPAQPMAGVAVYVPGITLELPWILPDVPLGDLRELSLPMPFLPVADLRAQRLPAWIRAEDDGGRLLADWRSAGPVPPLVREQFPDR